MVNVLCIKWGKKYGPEYVNILRSMVGRHLQREHRFICLTDDVEGIDAGVETLPMPKVDFPDFDNMSAWARAHGWLKLVSFANPLHNIHGPTLFIDLDVVIVGQLDPFFDLSGEFVVIREWDKRDGTGNTSVYRFNAGAHDDALAYFKQNSGEIRNTYRNEQQYITTYLANQGKMSFWPEAWCRSFKRHCVRAHFLNLFLPPRIPEGAKIIAFHGKPNPPDAIAGKSGKWYRRVIPTPWIKEHWR